jgi:hypothetical protein
MWIIWFISFFKLLFYFYFLVKKENFKSWEQKSGQISAIRHLDCLDIRPNQCPMHPYILAVQKPHCYANNGSSSDTDVER